MRTFCFQKQRILCYSNNRSSVQNKKYKLRIS
nr:unnamed protein product [Callosobruchus analis]